jgi:hypothetical protein
MRRPFYQLVCSVPGQRELLPTSYRYLRNAMKRAQLFASAGFTVTIVEF